MKKKLRASTVISLVILIPTVILALYIMVNHLGLIDSLDFGAGAYYYADMPNFQRWTDGHAYDSPVSMWALIALFLVWGAIMYCLWVWLDKHSK